MKTQTIAHRPGYAAPCFSPAEILNICRRFVYPPCKKLAGGIQSKDQLAADLGYFGSSAALLALKTNETFQLSDAYRITALDLALMSTVQDHVLAISKRLQHEDRLTDDAFGCFGVG